MKHLEIRLDILKSDFDSKFFLKLINSEKNDQNKLTIYLLKSLIIPEQPINDWKMVFITNHLFAKIKIKLQSMYQ